MKPLQYFPIIFFIIFSSSAHASINESSFEPAWWCRGGHLQTIYGGLFRAKPEIPLRRTRIELPDGDFIDLDRLDGDKTKPLIVILHGLGSSARVSYVLSILEEIQKLNWNAVAVNARGSLEPNRRLETNHGGKSEDLDAVINHLVENENSKEIYLIGYSLGGNILLKWLGEKGEVIPQEVIKAVAVSVPYDLEKSAHNLDRGFNREVYTRQLLVGLKAQAVEKSKKFPGQIDLEKVNKAKTFDVYDKEITAKLNGFRDQYDYWHDSSSVHYLDKIRIPVLLIHAENDPFLPKRDLPLEKINMLLNLTLLLTSDGGHLGFVTGNIPFQSKKWLEPTIIHFFEKH